jgi:glycosyltransferase involved in cell wall biosynthesis
MADFLSASDACVATLQNIPMFKMTYPNKIFDYMAAGKPIVLGIDGVIRKVVEESDCGRFFEPGNDEELAATILWMKNHADEANQMGERGREYVSERFNRHAHAAEFLKLAQSLVHKK